MHGLGVAVLPPMAVRSVSAAVRTGPIDPPLPRDLYAVIAADRPPTGAAQAPLPLLTARRLPGCPGGAPVERPEPEAA
jgi:DNA-binding transcriptional LysR family regulator